MGQAKQRGTYEQRVAEATARAEMVAIEREARWENAQRDRVRHIADESSPLRPRRVAVTGGGHSRYRSTLAIAALLVMGAQTVTREKDE